MAISVLLWKESLDPRRVLGVALIIVGVLVLNFFWERGGPRMNRLKPFFLFTDIGFITGLPRGNDGALAPGEETRARRKEGTHLDLLISATGLGSLALERRGDPHWRGLALISLILTLCSGLQAVAFWVLRADFDPTWWLPNLYLLLYPLFFIPGLLRQAAPTPLAAS